MADFTLVPNNAPPNIAVTFTPLFLGTTFEWDFGDGGTSTDEVATHRYSAPGTYTVTLTQDGSPSSTEVTVTGIVGSSNTIDLPLENLTDAQWSSISVKGTISAFPQKFYDNGGYPTRQCLVWPVPTTQQAVTLWLWEPLTTFTSLDEDFTFPKGYERALRFALAAELASEFGKEIPPQVKAVADQAKAVIKRLNSTPQVLVGDPAIANRMQGYFNWLTGDTT